MMLARHGELRAYAGAVANEASEKTNEGTEYSKTDATVRPLCFVTSLVITSR